MKKPASQHQQALVVAATATIAAWLLLLEWRNTFRQKEDRTIFAMQWRSKQTNKRKNGERR